jgi:hypothetical protein
VNSRIIGELERIRPTSFFRFVQNYADHPFFLNLYFLRPPSIANWSCRPISALPPVRFRGIPKNGPAS